MRIRHGFLSHQVNSGMNHLNLTPESFKELFNTDYSCCGDCPYDDPISNDTSRMSFGHEMVLIASESLRALCSFDRVLIVCRS